MRKVLLLLLLLGWSLSVNAQRSFQHDIYQSYVHQHVDQWERALNDQAYSFLKIHEQYDRAHALYGFVGLCIDKDQKKRGRPYLDELVEITDKLLDHQPNNPRYLALKGATYGLQMIYQPQKMMTLGPKTVKILKRAEETGPNVPQVLVELGNQLWVMPGVFGGDKEEAIKHYHKALDGLEKSAAPLKDNWYYLRLWVTLAEWNTELGRVSRARGIYLKVINMEPSFEMVSLRLRSLHD